MTEGTLASRRMTGSSMRLIGAGANSTMNTATNSELTNEMTTAAPVVRMVLQTSGQAWMRNCGARLKSPEVKIAWIWLSTLPPGPNQEMPLWANDDHASLKMKASIASR